MTRSDSALVHAGGNAPILLERVDIAECTTASRSAVATSVNASGVPTIFVHGIIENLYRWLTGAEASAAGTQLPDLHLSPPRFEFNASPNASIQISRRLSERGILTRFGQEDLAALAYSYQDLWTPIAPMAAAVEALHRVVAFALDRWGSDRVQLVGHSRGGLVCRHALLCDTSAFTAREFRRRVHRLPTIATPHNGSRLAEAIGVIEAAIDRCEELRRDVFSIFPQLAALLGQRTWPPLERLRETIETSAQLTPTSDEVRFAATAQLPPLPGGYAAIAGTTCAYFKIVAPRFGTFELPPSFPIPELTEGEGDMAVAVASALDIPNPTDANVARFNVNHFTNAYDRRVHEKVLEWTKRN